MEILVREVVDFHEEDQVLVRGVVDFLEEVEEVDRVEVDLVGTGEEAITIKVLKENCGRQLVPNVKKNVKFHLSRRRGSLFIVGPVTKNHLNNSRK